MKLANYIIRESILVVVIAGIISSFGSLGLEAFKMKLVTLVPLLIMLPALNSMVGDFGTLISSKVTILLHQKKMRGAWWKSYELGEQFRVISAIALFSAFYLGVASTLIAYFQGMPIEIITSLKVIAAAFMLVASLVLLIFFITVAGGAYVYRKGHDPNTYLIPITNSIADFVSLILFALVVVFLF